MNFDDIPAVEKAKAARDAWSLEPATGDELRDAMRALLRKESSVYPLLTAARAQSADDLVHRLERRHEEMAILLGVCAFDHDAYPELAETIRPLAASLEKAVTGLHEKARILAANPQAADSPSRIAALETAFDAIDANLAQGFAVIARALAQAPRVKSGVDAVKRRDAKRSTIIWKADER